MAGIAAAALAPVIGALAGSAGSAISNAADIPISKAKLENTVDIDRQKAQNLANIDVDRYKALTDFTASKMEEAGLPRALAYVQGNTYGRMSPFTPNKTYLGNSSWGTVDPLGALAPKSGALPANSLLAPSTKTKTTRSATPLGAPVRPLSQIEPMKIPIDPPPAYQPRYVQREERPRVLWPGPGHRDRPPGSAFTRQPIGGARILNRYQNR